MKKDLVISLLRNSKLKATPKRIAVLNYLISKKQPVSVKLVSRDFQDINQTSVYRMLDAMVEKGILMKHDLGRGHCEYEYTGGVHKHHLVCTDCEQTEAVQLCREIDKKALEQSSNFVKIVDHSVTFFGKCRKCID